QAAASVDTIPGGDVDEAVWHLDSLVWNGQDLSEAVTSLVESGGNLTFELGVPFDEKGLYQLEEADILRSGILELRSFAEARETMLEYRRSLEVWERQKEEERQRIQSRMKELDVRIEEMALGHN
ncbi:MAG: hypothetical protein LUC94_03935, partial [Clostridiales bacterium]|nr:hypothetical protein [Clostridiales bacterium]